MRCSLHAGVLLLISILGPGPGSAEVPGEVAELLFTDRAEIGWTPVPGTDSYHVYRGSLGSEAARCHGFAVPGTAFQTASEPDSGAGFFYLVTAESATEGEGTPGNASGGGERPLIGSCGAVMRHHVLSRLGYGWSEWSRDRLQALGVAGYIAEQLDPGSIDEGTNDDLNDRLVDVDPPSDIVGLIQRQIVMGVYARRQLEQQVATFWTNHFNTYWNKLYEIFRPVYPQCAPVDPLPQCDPAYPVRAQLETSVLQHRETEDFRQLAFNGTFRQIVEKSALSPAMIVFLDTYTSVVGNPNENFPRELLELYTLGVGGGYTQADVEELSRVITGWTACTKVLSDVDDPLAPCVEAYWQAFPAREWVATFVTVRHDCTEKILFAGTPEEVVIPDTCADPDQGVDDLYLALDAIAAHPSTARFISKKILERFVTDEPDEAMIDVLVAAWNDPGNLAGTGDLRAVLAAALSLEAFTDPDRVRSKLKTPLEQMVSAIRATRGRTDGRTDVVNFLVGAQHLPYFNPVPTGWAERGDGWIGTNNYLTRQNFAITLMASDAPEFGADVLEMLRDNGVSTQPGNAEGIVDFLSDALFGGALTPAERRDAVEYIETDAFGNPAPYDDGRIVELTAVLLGFPHFQEQ
jgi:uncharacterized protein (DUF1800 family)